MNKIEDSDDQLLEAWLAVDKKKENNRNAGPAAAASFFSHVPVVPELEQFHKNAIYQADPFTDKVNLTVGAYRDENGVPFVLPVVQEAKRRLFLHHQPADYEAVDAEDVDQNFSSFGYQPFVQSAMELLLGANSSALRERRALGIQCLSGTGALKLGAEFLHQVLGLRTVFLSDPAWNGYHSIFQMAGFTDIRHYHYYDRENRALDFEGMLRDLQEAGERDVIVLQACAHNPTGLDLSKAQWMQVAEVVKQRRLLPFFDIAYPGFASGDPQADAWAVRHFAEQHIEMLAMQSFSKNFGLYNERVGTLTIVLAHQPSEQQQFFLHNIRSQLEPIIHSLWANPPLFGARIVHAVLSSPELRQEWLRTLETMTKRLVEVRRQFRECLDKQGLPISWTHITEQTGFFSYTGLTAKQMDHLQRQFHVYMLADGRANMCGLNQHNVQYVADAFGSAIRQQQRGGSS